MQAKKWLMVLVGFIVIIIGWAVSIQALSGYKERAEQANLISMADDFMERELYVRAIPLYEQALNNYSFGNENELQTILLEAYFNRGDMYSYDSLVEQRIADGTATEEEYLNYARNCFSSFDEKNGLRILREGLTLFDSEEIRDLYESYRYDYSIRNTGYQEILPVWNGYAPAFDGENWCYVNSKGKRQGGLYDAVTRYNDEGIAVVSRDGEFYAVNLFEEKYGIDDIGVDSVPGMSNWGILAEVDGKVGFYSYDFVLASKDLQFEYVSGLASGLYAVMDSKGWGLLNADGQIVAETGTYEEIAINSLGEAYMYGVAMAKGNHGWYMIDRNGESINDEKFYDAKAPESDGYIAVADSDGKWGFADRSGNLVIDYKYDDAMSFSDGLAPVLENGYWHYISIYDEVAIDLDLIDANPFHNGVAIAYFVDGESIISLVYYEK